MKFLYLKGIDIFGPFEPEQIAKEDCFSEELLVCPEDNAEQEAAWKPVSHYEEFKNILDKNILHIEETNQIVNKSFEEVSENSNPESLTTENSNTENSEKNENISQDLPPLEETETETSNKEIDTFSFDNIMNDMSSSKEQDNSAETQEEDVKDHTFRVANKEDNLLEDLPAHSLIGTEADRENSLDENISAKPNNEAQDLVPADKQDSIKETSPENGKDFLEISNNKIISSSDGRVKKRNSNDLLFILSFIVLTIVAIALCMAFWNMMNRDKDKNIEVTQKTNIEQPLQQEERPFTEDTKQQITEDEIKTDDIALKTPASVSAAAVPLETQVIDVVKNTQLASKKRTIGEYLDKVYGSEYQYSWSAKPFTDKVYIVEFFASQVRHEPFVYLFRVDLDKKKITGALNNMTLDLLA